MDILWKHTKTRGLYRIVGFCVIEDGWVAGVKYVKAEGSGEVVRPCHEFFDGRFQQVDVTPMERDITLAEMLFPEVDVEATARMHADSTTSPDGRNGTMELTMTSLPDELDKAGIVPDGQRFGGRINPDSIAAKAERHFAAKKGEGAL